ncbi:MAG: DUF2461 domain-containing protein [Flavobacteriales bacterium]|nr:DUF2461 domain-containing protein [Flavobacteriales bacterium]
MYFNKAFVDFFKGLAANNNREWFLDNKKIYDKEVKKPFEQLVADLIEATGSKLLVKDATFRINKDIRFSKDKSPYKLHVGAVISDGGRKDMTIPGMYLHLSAEEQWIGGGMYMPEKNQLEQIRMAIANNPKTWDKMLQNPDFIKFYTSIKGEKNKILPKELKEFGDNEWVYNKQFYYMAEYHDQQIPTKPDLLPFIMQHYEAGKEFISFFKATLGK